MAETYVVSGLVAKRAEMAGLIDHHQKQIAQLGTDLAHLDATLKLFAPEMDLRSLRAKEHRERNHYFAPNEQPRFVLDTLRQAGEPLTTAALAERAIALKGLEGGADLVDAVQKSLHGALKPLAQRGTIVEGPRLGTSRTWQIA